MVSNNSKRAGRIWKDTKEKNLKRAEKAGRKSEESHLCKEWLI